MGGIVFFGTKDLNMIKDFYTGKIGMKIWLDQGTCCILMYYNLLLGFCRKDTPDTSGVITFFCRDKAGVDAFFTAHSHTALSEPKTNTLYNIYNFFAKDPEGRTIEFQTFLHDLKPYMDGINLLESRRSVRQFSDKQVSMDTIHSIINTCRYSPTSRNTQGYYYLVINNRKKISFLASLRGKSSEPIKMAPLAVAVCADPGMTLRYVDDSVIAAYHFMLSAHLHGLGTCWIAAMNTEEVKKCLCINSEHYIATITPLGYPSALPDTPERKETGHFLRFLS